MIHRGMLLIRFRRLLWRSRGVVERLWLLWGEEQNLFALYERVSRLVATKAVNLPRPGW